MRRCAIPTCKMVGMTKHSFPKQQPRRDKWVNFVRLIVPNFTPTTHTVICEAHFEQSCYNRNFPLEQKFGYHSKRHNLRDDAVPTILYPKMPTILYPASLDTYALKDSRRILPKPCVEKDPVYQQIPVLLVPESHEDSQSNLPPAVLLPASSRITQTCLARSIENKHYKEGSYAKPSRAKCIVQNLKGGPNVHAEKQAVCFTFEEVKIMMSLSLVKFFSSEVKIKDPNMKAMRCRLFPAYLCPFVISCPNLEECESVMRLHLRQHVKNCIRGAEKDPQFFAKMKFRSVLHEKPLDNCLAESLAHTATDVGALSTVQEVAIGTETKASITDSSQQMECGKSLPSTSAMEQTNRTDTESEKTQSSHSKTFVAMHGNLLKSSLSTEAEISHAPRKKKSFTAVLPCSTALSKVFSRAGKTKILPKTFSTASVTNAKLNQASTSRFIKFDDFFNKSPRKYLLAPSRTRVSTQNTSEPVLSLVLHPLVNLVNPKVPVPSLRQRKDSESDIPVITKITGSAPPIEENPPHSATLKTSENFMHYAAPADANLLPSGPTVEESPLLSALLGEDKSLRLIEKVDATTQVEPSENGHTSTNGIVKMEQLHDRLCETSHSQKTSVVSETGSDNITNEKCSIPVPSLPDLANKALSKDLSMPATLEKNSYSISDNDFLLSSIEEDFNFLSYSGVNCEEFEDSINLSMHEVEISQTSDTVDASTMHSDDLDPVEQRNTVANENKNFDVSTQIGEQASDTNHDNSEQIDKNTKLKQKKENFLSILGLQRTTVITPPPEINSNFLPVPIPKFRTRAQKKTALFERFFLKRKAELIPKELRVHLQPIPPKTLKKDSNETAKNPIVSRNLRRRRRSMQKFYLSRLEQSSKSALSCEYKDIKGYNLRRANMLKKRAHDQVKQPSSHQRNMISQSTKQDEKSVVVPYTAVGEVMRMPVDSLIELYEEEWKITKKYDEEEEKKRLMEKEMERIKKQDEGNTIREVKIHDDETDVSETEDPSTFEDQKIPKNKVVLRRMKLPEHLRPPGKGPRKIMPTANKHFALTKKNKVSEPLEIEVNGEVIQIKNEPLTSDEEDLTFYKDSAVLTSDDEVYNNYRPTLTVSNLLFNKRKDLGRPYKGYTEMQSSETEDSEDEGVDEYVMEGVDEQAVFSENESEEEIIVVDDEIVKQEFTPKVPVEKVLEITKEAEKIAAPSLSEGEIEVLAFYNDHTYSHVNGERRRKMISLLARPVCDDMVSNTFLPSLVSETEYKVREKALEYLRNLKQCENQQQNGAVSDGNISDNLTCMICSKKFTASNSMYYHYRSHAGVKPFKCEICNKSFTRLHSLNYHVMIHENKTRFKCKYCNRGFRHPTHFKEHLNKHTGQEPFFCPICDRRFKTSNSQRRHMRSKHNLRFGESAKRTNALSLQAAPPGGGVDISSSSPPLPDSPSPPALPMKPFSFPQNKSVKLVLFPKNGISRVSYNDE